jgi:hypothetical protein
MRSLFLKHGQVRNNEGNDSGSGTQNEVDLYVEEEKHIITVCYDL